MNEIKFKAFLTKLAAGVVTFGVLASLVGATLALESNSGAGQSSTVQSNGCSSRAVNAAQGTAQTPAEFVD